MSSGAPPKTRPSPRSSGASSDAAPANSGPPCDTHPPGTKGSPDRWLTDRSINALVESSIGLYKNECVRVDGPFRTVDELELATLIWVDWFNTTWLHSSIGDIPPIEFELDYYRPDCPLTRRNGRSTSPRPAP